eukprot:6838104-Prymnesium_polylepis.1
MARAAASGDVLTIGSAEGPVHSWCACARASRLASVTRPLATVAGRTALRRRAVAVLGDGPAALLGTD